MTDEEKKAIDILKNSIADYVIASYCKECIDFPICEKKNEDCYFTDAIDTILNLIEKQSKEIEELKKPKYIFNCKTNEITKLTNDFVSKDKIKAKVIEIKDRPVKDEFITATQGKLNTIIDIENLINEEE